MAAPRPPPYPPPPLSSATPPQPQTARVVALNQVEEKKET